MSENANDMDALLGQLRMTILCLEPEIVGSVQIENDRIVCCDGDLQLEVAFVPGGEDSKLVHVHIFSHLNLDPPKTLCACVVGSFNRPRSPYTQIAEYWTRSAAPPIISYLRNRELLGAKRFEGEEIWGVPRKAGFRGPFSLISYGQFDDILFGEILEHLEEEAPFFNTAELVADTRTHLAQCTLLNMGTNWDRTLEIDDHYCSIPESTWFPKKLETALPEGIKLILLGYAVFEESKNYFPNTESAEVDLALERMMKFYASNMRAEFDAKTLRMIGVEGHLIKDFLAFVPIAFARRFFFKEYFLEFSETYDRVEADGSIRRDLPLIKEFVFRRASLLAPGFMYSKKYEGVFQFMVQCSDIYQTVEDMIHKGKNRDDLRFYSPTIYDMDYEGPKQPLPKTGSMIPTENPNRRWWEFWK